MSPLERRLWEGARAEAERVWLVEAEGVWLVEAEGAWLMEAVGAWLVEAERAWLVEAEGAWLVKGVGEELGEGVRVEPGEAVRFEAEGAGTQPWWLPSQRKSLLGSGWVWAWHQQPDWGGKVLIKLLPNYIDV